MKSVTAHGDTIAYYKEEDGEEDIYSDNTEFEREAVVNAMNESNDPAEIEAFKKYLKCIDYWEETDKEIFSGYYIILQINPLTLPLRKSLYYTQIKLKGNDYG